MATKRLIDANALMEMFKKDYCEPCDDVYGICCSSCWIDNVDIAVDAQPTVDAVEVVHGEWVQIGYDKAMDRITCSCCKEYWNIRDNDTDTFNYCPNCGAKMDGDGNA